MLLCWHNHCIHSPVEWKPFLPFISGLPSLIAGLHFPIVQCPHCLVLTFVDSTWVLCLSLPHSIFWNFMVLHSLVEELSLAITWELEYLENYRVLLAKSYQVTFQLASFSYPLTTQNPSQHPQPWLLPAMLSYLKFHHCACLHHLTSARKVFFLPSSPFYSIFETQLKYFPREYFFELSWNANLWVSISHCHHSYIST